MNPTNHIRRHILPSCLLLALTLALTAQTASAIMINMTVTPLGGGLFSYDFSIDNNEPVDLVLVSIVDAPVADALIFPTLVTPAGFLGNYDSGLGIVDFISDASLFAAGSTMGGFSFQSQAGPGTHFTTFEALSVAGDSFRGAINGTVSNVPESGSTFLMAVLGVMTLAFARRRFATVNN